MGSGVGGWRLAMELWLRDIYGIGEALHYDLVLVWRE